ncbi:hypothetical protein ACLB2K_076479 [Fragaria x ananassa]
MREESWHSQRKWYFFTRIDYKYTGSSRVKRTTKEGFWKITGKDRAIKAPDSKAVSEAAKALYCCLSAPVKTKPSPGSRHQFKASSNLEDSSFVFQDASPFKTEVIVVAFKASMATQLLHSAAGSRDDNKSRQRRNDAAFIAGRLQVPRNEVVSKQEKGDFVLCRLKNKSDKKDSSVSNEGEPGRGDDEMNQEGDGELLFHQPQTTDDCCSSALWSPASQELEAVLQTNGTTDRNQVSTFDENENDVYPQLRNPPDENLDSLLLALQPQDYCPPILHPLQPQDYQPLVIFQSPINTKQGNVLDANLYYGGCKNWQPESKRTISTDKVDIPVRHVMSNIENQASDYRSLEVPHPRTEVNLESAVYPFQPQDSTLQPLMYTNFGDALHNIECNELQSSFGDNHSSFGNIPYQDYYSSDQTAQTPFKDSCRNHWEWSTMGIVE